MTIYVGNLDFRTTEETVRAAFEAYGEVATVRLVADRQTGRPRGFGFVEMPREDEARAAIAELDGKELDGRNIKVNEARSRGEGGPRRKRARR